MIRGARAGSRPARVLSFLALGVASVAILAACASILGIEDASFADLEGGGASEGDAPSAGGDAADERTVGADGGPEGGPPPTCMPCRSRPGTVCPGGCLSAICSACGCGTINVAPLGKANASAGGVPTRLTDKTLENGWASPSDSAGQEVWVTFPQGRTVGRIAIYGPRTVDDFSSAVARVHIQVAFSGGGTAGSTNLLTEANGDYVWDRPATANVGEVRIRILDTKDGKAPAMSEIELCGE